MADDERLEQALRDGLADRTAELEIPSGMGHRARRIARRRSAVRASLAVVPLTVVAVVVVVLLAGGRGHAPSGPRPKALTPHQVISEVSERVAQISRTGGVLETITNAGPPMHEWEYTDLRNGITYDLMRYTNRRGKLVSIYWNRAHQLGGGRIANTALEIFGTARTWTTEHGVTHATGSAPSIQSTAHQIGRALKHGRVTLQGKATIQGRTVLELHLLYHIRGGRYELYVDPHTYRPIEQVVRLKVRGHKVTDRIYLRSPTPANIAHATRRPTIPSGFKFFKTVTGPPRYPPGHKKRHNG